jgi:hypothetical protein
MIMKAFRILSGVILFCLLTALTQIGGVVFLLVMLSFRPIDRVVRNTWSRIAAKLASFSLLYLVFVFGIVPPVAKLFGRVPLPVFEDRHLKPATIWTCLLCRNYVREPLRKITYKVAERMNEHFSGTTVNYLDANFPLIDKFPLLPHLSHNDGKKLDLAFQYDDSVTGKQTMSVPSFIGYGICEEPGDGEENKPAACAEKGYWQYNALRTLVPQGNKAKFTFNNERTKQLVIRFTSQKELGKIFIEPHLKTRLGLTSSKIRFHGCQAVRHDDHIHVELK